MRYGFFFGLEGDRTALSSVLERLAGCDRIVSLGNLVGGGAKGDLTCWTAFAQLGPRALALGGSGERRLAQAPWIPPALRRELRALEPAALEGGVAILGGGVAAQPRAARERVALGGAPRLVAPITVAAHQGETRLWRAAGGDLARSVEVEAGMEIPLGDELLRLELGRSCDGQPICAVVDLGARRLELHPVTRVAAAPRERRRPRPSTRRVDERQCLLAV